MRYASAAAAERRSAMLARKAEKTVRKRRDKCIRTLEPQHLNRRVLIRKRPRSILSNVDRLLRKMPVPLGPMPKAIAEGTYIRRQSRIFSPTRLRSHRAHAAFCGIRARLT